MTSDVADLTTEFMEEDKRIGRRIKGAFRPPAVIQQKMRGRVLMFDPLELLKVAVISEAVGGGGLLSSGGSFTPLL